ncbi:uncharacterized protein LOC127095299 [Lathyrus oleraceus]|uniref:uncharacterized protein LOC127095299 n=1 Tax=Pisum sativum TaxID=3888 RepID=UPI0021CFF952|nr:uncharacterized protein LOC127095299 [Pisum sativum]
MEILQQEGHGIEAIITSPTGYHIPFTARLCFTCTNNMSEYESCILGLDDAIDLRIKILEVYRDSALVINKIKGEYGTHNAKLIRYRYHVRKMITYFDEITFHYIPQEENQLADALATLSSRFKVKWYNEAPPIRIQHLDEPIYCIAVEAEMDNKTWSHDIKLFLQKQEYPANASSQDKKTLRRLASQFFLNSDVLYKQNHDMVLLRCLDGYEADMLIKKIHEGSFGTHANGHTMAKKILRAGYYWLTMESDSFKYVTNSKSMRIKCMFHLLS